MSLTDTTFSNLTGEVRIRQGAAFQQIPNLVEAGENLANGQFVQLSEDGGQFRNASQTTAATHLVLKSAEPRITAEEIATLTGSVVEGESVMAITGGPGTVDIPFAGNVNAGDELMVNSQGYAVRKSGAAFVVGVATQTVIVSGATAVGTALLTLPATWRAS